MSVDETLRMTSQETYLKAQNPFLLCRKRFGLKLKVEANNVNFSETYRHLIFIGYFCW